jgi:hypothetical protein
MLAGELRPGELRTWSVRTIEGAAAGYRPSMSDEPSEETEPPIEDTELPDSFRRNRRQHGGAAQRLNDDRLERLTEEEREAAGLDPDPDERHDEEDEADGAG